MTQQSDRPRAIQLRRYRFEAGEVVPFAAWWRDRLVPVRESFGFAVEFAYMIEESGEFVWAVGVAGDVDEFRRVEAEYQSSPARAAAFQPAPPTAVETRIDLVTTVG